MSDVLRAMAISGSILFGVVILLTIVAFVTVNRGEVEMAKDAKKSGHSTHH
jgi:hypothetical protein